MHMAAGKAGFADVTYDLIAMQDHALKAGTITASMSVTPKTPDLLNDIAPFFRDAMTEDSIRAARAHELLKNITGTE